MRIIVLAFVLLVTAANAAAATEQVYIRGLFGMVFSPGIKELAAIKKQKHICWCNARKVTKELAAKKEPVVIVGHSLGADQALIMAKNLKTKGVPVKLVIVYDATRNFDMKGIPTVNFRSRDFRAKDVANARNTYRPDLNHINLTTDPRVRGETLRLLVQALD
jgi:hypothetical protein